MEKTLELRNVSVVRGGVRILDSVDLGIEAGESIAVIGPNGSGKTTLIKLLRGDILPYYDEESPAVLRILGRERWNLFELRGRMGVVSMDLQGMFSPATTVREVILSGFFNSLDVFRNHQLSDAMERAAFSAALTMGIGDIMARPIGNLSLGEMRRALIARALVTGPDLLVLDEPMTGLDVVMRSRFRAMFDVLIGSGVDVVMITHDLADIPAAVRRVVMIRDGKVFRDGPKEELLDSATVSELYGAEIVVEEDAGAYRMRLAEEVA